LPPAYGDPVMAKQVLVNLLGNAVKFTAKNPDPHVEIGALTMNEECVYYVRDNGIGFDPAHADRLFDPFERLHYEPEYRGSGLGLTTVKQIITRHGGRVWADGTPGGGATFYFTLPEPGRCTSV
jgi:signal transduction histidine kinase